MYADFWYGFLFFFFYIFTETCFSFEVKLDISFNIKTHILFCVCPFFSYETTSSEESSGDEKSKVDAEEEEEKFEPDVGMEKDKESEETAEIQGAEAEALSEGGEAAREEKEVEKGLLDLEGGHELLGEQYEGWGG